MVIKLKYSIANIEIIKKRGCGLVVFIATNRCKRLQCYNN